MLAHTCVCHRPRAPGELRPQLAEGLAMCGRNPLAEAPCSIVDAGVWAYVRALAQLPGYHMEERDNGGREMLSTTALSRILRVPNTYQTRSDFLTHGIRSLLYDGNWYSLA